MFRLPISGTAVLPQAPNGFDQALLMESRACGFALRLLVVKRLVPPVDEGQAWDDLPAADVDAALLGLRRLLRGELLIAEIECPHCGSKGDVRFSIDHYLEQHRPRPKKGVTGDAEGWMAGEGFRFRIPTAGQMLAAESSEKPEAFLESCCIEAGTRKVRQRALAALERAAPLLSGPLEGACPGCGAPQSTWFEPGEFVVEELRGLWAGLFEETHLVASRYHWPEETILSMPAVRRARYAELIVNEIRGQGERAAIG